MAPTFGGTWHSAQVYLFLVGPHKVRKCKNVEFKVQQKSVISRNLETVSSVIIFACDYRCVI